jgi:hypothetical protein
VSREAIVSVVVAMISLGLAGFLWAVRVPETRITLKVHSESVALRLAQAWSWRGHLPLDTRLVSLDALTTLASPELFSELTSTQGDAWLTLTGGKAALVALHLEQNGMIEGTLLMHDVSESVTLREGEPLTLTGIRGRLVELRSGHPLALQFEGTVRKVRVGPPDAQGDLAPSFLRYYYHQEPLTFFWSAVVFFWGVLWSIRQTVFH